MSTIAVLTPSETGANSLIDINNNFANLNANKAEKPNTVYTVGVAGQYPDIQSGLNAFSLGGGTLQLLDPVYTLTASLTIKYPFIEIVGNALGTIIECDGSVVSPLIKVDPAATPQTVGRCALRNVSLFQTNPTVQGIAIDGSNMSINIYDNVSITNFGTAEIMNDTTNFTFFNRTKDFKMFNCIKGIDLTSTNPVNDNMWDNIRFAPNASGNGAGLTLTNGQGNSFYNLNCEAASGNGAGVFGIHINTSSPSVFDTLFVDVWCENNAGNVNIGAGGVRTTFIGGNIVWGVDTNSAVIDAGTDTSFFNTRVDTALATTTVYNRLGNFISTDSSTGNGTTVFQNNTNYAHITNALIQMKLLNAGDTSNVLELSNAGSGMGLNNKARRADASINVTFATSQNDLAIGASTFFRMSNTSGGSVNLTGIVAGVDGQKLYLRNIGTQSIVLKNQSASSAAANRFLFTTGADITLAANGSVSLMYDITSACWFNMV